MTNITQELHQLMEQRRSMGILTDPAPTLEQLNTALTMAKFAPDHRHLHPTRFVIVQSEQRYHLVDILVHSVRKSEREITQSQIDKIQQQILRAPMIVLAFTRIQQHEKVPAFEQLLSTGAAMQNVLLSLQAQGFSTMWRTGEWVNSTTLKQHFGLTTDDYLSAILYIGTTTRTLSPRPEYDDAQFIQFVEQFPLEN